MSAEFYPHSGRPSKSRTDENVEIFENKTTRIVGTQLKRSQKLKELYLEVLRLLRENVRRKRPEMWRSGDWFLHHDNAPAHTALSVTQYWAYLGWTVVPHPPYSLDLATCFFFIPDKEKSLNGKRVATVEEVKTASQEALKNIKLQQFRRCFTQWEKILDKSIASSGDYFEGDYVFFVRNINKSFFYRKSCFFGSPLIYSKKTPFTK